MTRLRRFRRTESRIDQGFARNFNVVEWHRAIADDLDLLMPFAGDQDDVSRACLLNRQPNGFSAIRL
jgi:hypothetical protein